MHDVDGRNISANEAVIIAPGEEQLPGAGLGRLLILKEN